MKAFPALILLATIISIPIMSTTHTDGQISAGVKKGDWMEYNVNITGKPPPIHNVTWMRIEILQVEDQAFPVNLTVRYVNGTLSSSTWKFNFTEGNTEGWIIIPANLNQGENFYDAYSKTNKNITIQKQEQQIVLGSSRTVTFGNDSIEQKEWDKATGVFVQSFETFKNWNATVTITATNLWNSKTQELDQTTFIFIVATSAILAVIPSLLIIVARKRKTKKPLFKTF